MTKPDLPDTQGMDKWNCLGCGSTGWSWQRGKLCSECGDLFDACKQATASHPTDLFQDNRAVCSQCGHEVIPGPGWNNEHSLCQTCDPSRAASHAQPENQTHADIGVDIHPNTLQPTSSQDTGDVPPSRSVEPPAGSENPPARELLSATFKRRMEKEGRWREVSKVRDRMMVESKQAIPDKDERREWVAGEMDRMYPPLTVQTSEIPIHIGNSAVSPLIPTKAISETASDTGQIQGLSDLPKGWPELPANASLAAEVGWVQANRLFMVEERPGKATRVRLGKASTPAPSRAALGWLETSIRSYAKFVDVAAKASTGAEDEGAVMRRERKSVDEVRALLEEMQAAEGTCPSCGKPF